MKSKIAPTICWGFAHSSSVVPISGLSFHGLPIQLIRPEIPEVSKLSRIVFSLQLLVSSPSSGVVARKEGIEPPAFGFGDRYSTS